jgi:hypothetical protein
MTGKPKTTPSDPGNFRFADNTPEMKWLNDYAVGI